MRLKLINPNMTASMTKEIQVHARRYAAQDTEILCEGASFGVESIECFTDEALAVPFVLQAIREGDREQRADAYIIACFDDPGLNAARELTEKPVIGIAEAAMGAARFIAPNFSVVSILKRSKKMTEELIYRNGMERFCRSIRATGLSVIEFQQDKEKGVLALEREARKAVEEDGAECILLGCAGFVDFACQLEKKLKVPVLDGVMPAVKFAEALVSMGLTTSKISSWNFPEKKRYEGYPGIVGKSR